MKRATAILLPAAIVLAIGACAIPRWPVEGELTSEYGLRFSGVRPGWHHGVDIAVPEGTPVHAMRAGTVTFAGVMGDYGNVVILRHSRRLRSVYGHLSAIDVSRGDRVQHRQVLGRSGRTGNAAAPHLHFEIVRFGRSEDPVPLLGGRPANGGR
jgi:murein DD-endopeptidase MepM/ murein hydrolase activator NlpD